MTHFVGFGDGRDNEHRTIQAAINKARDGDTVIVNNGIYTGDGNRDIDFKGKHITVKSIHEDPTDCIIEVFPRGASGVLEAKGSHRGFVFRGKESPSTSFLIGFTIRNGKIRGKEGGGGVLCVGQAARFQLEIQNSVAGKLRGSPTIRNCVVENCESEGDGGGIRLANGSVARIEDCKCAGNRTATGGGGLAIDGSLRLDDGTRPSVHCRRIRVYSNRAGGDGGGVFMEKGSSPLFVDCEVSANVAGGNGGGVAADSSRPRWVTSQIDSNIAQLDGGGVWLNYCSSVGITIIGPSENSVDAATFRDCLVNSNSCGSTGRGGGVFARGGLFKRYRNDVDPLFVGGVCVVRSIVLGNRGNRGAGVFGDNAQVTIADSVVNENAPIVGSPPLAADGGPAAGGGVFVAGNRGSLTLIMSTLYRNEARERSGGVHVAVGSSGAGPQVVVYSTIVWGNRAPNWPSVGTDGRAALMVFGHSDVEDLAGVSRLVRADSAWVLPGGANIDANPGFDASQTVRGAVCVLTPESPCRCRGARWRPFNPAFPNPPTLPRYRGVDPHDTSLKDLTDIAGQVRWRSPQAGETIASPSDIGAYELDLGGAGCG